VGSSVGCAELKTLTKTETDWASAGGRDRDS